MSLAAVNIPKYAQTINTNIGKLGNGTSWTVPATLLGNDGTATGATVVYTAGAYGGVCESLMASTNDLAAVNVFVYILSGSSVQPLGLVNVPLSSGNANGVANVDLINGLIGLPVNSMNKKYIPLKANQSIKVSVLAAMTANKCLWVRSSGTDLTA